MTSNLPAKLKSADIGRFALRAAQLETAKPAVAYWCEYWIVNQLLARQLHSADAECLQYTTNLMDKLEQTKTKYADDDAVIDDAAGQAYVERFALETFERADRAVQADKVTKQTADTFLAASTFLELLNIWGEPGQEVHAKIRYAKWNAVRIVKAIKDGTDPNESNPKPEPEPEPELEPLDPNDPEVQALGGTSASLQPSVEEVPDEHDRLQPHLAAQSAYNQSLHPSQQPSAQPSPDISPLPHGHQHHASQDEEVSPMEESPHTRDNSLGGGYFPQVPSGTYSGNQPSAIEGDDVSPPDLPDPSQLPPPGSRTEADDMVSFPPPPSALKEDNHTPLVDDFYRQTAPSPATQPQQPQQPWQPPVAPLAPTSAPLHSAFPHPASPPGSAGAPPRSIPSVASSQPPYSNPAPVLAAPVAPAVPQKQNLITDDIAIAKAQKHARWAISALNFEDAETAVKELRAALQTLGAL